MTETHDQGTSHDKGTSHETFATHTHSYLCQQIQMADQKAGFSLAFNSALIASIYASCISGDEFGGDGYALTVFVLAGLSMIVSIWTVWPRTRVGRGKKREPQADLGIVFWEGILHKRPHPGQYADAVKGRTAEQLSLALLEHIHALARVCQEKYCCLRFAIAVSAIAIAPSLAYFIAFFSAHMKDKA